MPFEQPRTIVIGLDALDYRLVERWSSAGELPCLKQLLATCPTVKLSTPSRVLQGTVWPSVLTGVSPGRHGLYLQTQLRNGTYALTDKFAAHVRPKRFYQHMGDAGLRCGLADIPADSPVTEMRGLQVVEWATEFRFWRYATVPRAFAQFIRSHIGQNPMTKHWNSGDSQESHTKLCASLETSIRMKAKLARHLIERKDLDLVFCVFGEAHKAGHWLWKYYDETHPNHETSPSVLKNGLLNAYKQIDRALGEILELISADDNLIVFSDHGMQPAYRGEHLTDQILEKLGLLVYDAKPMSQTVAGSAPRPETRARQRFNNAKLALKRRLPQAVLAALNKRKNSFPGVDWGKTRVFSLPTDRHSHIRVNLRGREPMGIVEPGADYDLLLDQLEAALKALINPRTGRAAVEEMFRVRTLFPGECADDLPDVSILWSAEAPMDEVSSPQLGVIRNPIRELRSGNHREEGFLLARGPNFSEGRADYKGHILQIAPTLLHLHGVPIPDQYEMPPFDDILK
jgi:predicted AlkP superfamily phosphohydrolase/phosphomutase